MSSGEPSGSNGSSEHRVWTFAISGPVSERRLTKVLEAAGAGGLAGYEARRRRSLR